MTENLKSCPFCGGKPDFENEGSDYGFYAVCSRCGCWTGALRTKDESLKRWNNRPIEDELAEKIKKLEAKNTKMQVTLEEISRGFDSDSRNYTREDMIRIAKEALKGEDR